jgi:hypothetical protein
VTSLTCEVSPRGELGVVKPPSLCKMNEGWGEANKQGNTLITASLDNIARTFSYPQNEYTGYVTRSASVPIRWVSLDKKGERVAVCSEYVLPPSSSIFGIYQIRELY